MGKYKNTVNYCMLLIASLLLSNIQNLQERQKKKLDLLSPRRYWGWHKGSPPLPCSSWGPSRAWKASSSLFAHCHRHEEQFDDNYSKLNKKFHNTPSTVYSKFHHKSINIMYLQMHPKPKLGGNTNFCMFPITRTDDGLEILQGYWVWYVYNICKSCTAFFSGSSSFCPQHAVPI